MILLLLACVHPVPPDVGPPPTPGHVTLLHTNDLHGHYLAEPADWLEGRPPIGGFVRLDAEVDAIRATRPDDAVLLLDGGDMLTGTPLTDLTVEGSRGGAMLDFMRLIGYDAIAVGNHEFDKGLDNLTAYAASSKIPLLSANVRTADGVSPLLPNQTFSRVFEASGVRIGVIGATTDSLGWLMNRRDFARLKLLSAEVAVREEVARLDPQTDVIVVLSHIGVDADESLARRVPGIDLIVGGHSHTRLTAAKHINDTWIVQAGSYTRSLGVVEMDVADDRLVSFTYELRDLLPATAPGPASAEVNALARAYEASIDAAYGEVLSQSPALLGRDYHHENGLGRWITDVLRETTGADVGLYNGGGLRADLPAGTLTLGALYGCFPFGNEVMTFDISGEDLQSILLRNAIAETDEKRGFLPISGVSYTWRVRAGAPELVEARVGGQPLDHARTYRVATNSYIAEQWEKQLGVEPRNLRGEGISDFDAAVAYARRGPVRDAGDVRAQKIE